MKTAFVLVLAIYTYVFLWKNWSVKCYDKKSYANSKPGYLYNVGYGGFIANGEVDHGVQFVKVTKNPHQALRLVQIAMYYQDTPFIIILADGVHSNKKGKIYASSAGLNIYGGIKYSRVSIEGEMHLGSHRIVIGTPVQPYSEAVLIMIYNKCMMADTQGHVNIHKCISTYKDAHRYQEWIWIDQDRYEADMRSNPNGIHYTGVVPAHGGGYGSPGFGGRGGYGRSGHGNYNSDDGYNSTGLGEDISNPERYERARDRYRSNYADGYGHHRHGDHCCRRRAACSYCDYYDDV
ncbi:hypothetical protein NEOKW01_1362 [Nematocida sp. AWRm80]|nr:hypothetical protein NEOKW01_1362 [Nematocida sp. AWRm80]